MNIGQLDAPNPTLDTMNPVTQGMQRAMQRNLLTQERMKQAQLMPYVGPQAEQQLEMAKQQNKYFGPQAQSEIGLRNAQAQNAMMEAAKIKFMLDNPGFMGGDASRELAGLNAMGFPISGTGNSGAAPNSAAAPSSGGTPSSPFGNGSILGAGIQSAIQAMKDQGLQGDMADASPSTASAASTPQDNSLQGALDSAANQSMNRQVVNPGVASKFSGSEPFKNLLPGVNPAITTILDKPYADAAYSRQMARGYNWGKMDQDQRNYMIGIARANGIDASVAAEKFANGYTVPDLMQEYGIDINSKDYNPNPNYVTPKSAVEKQAETEQYTNRLNVLSQSVMEGMGPYAQTYFGYSPKQVMDSFTGMNKDQQIKFAKAMILVPDLVISRIKSQGGNVSAEAVQDMIKRNQLNVDYIRNRITPEIWIAAQQGADETINQSVNAAANVLQGVGKKPPQESESEGGDLSREQVKDMKPGTEMKSKSGVTYIFTGGDPSNKKNWKKA